MLFEGGFSFANFLTDVLAVFVFVIWFWLLITVFADLFRRHDISGWAKAGWIVLCVILPYVGVLIYMISQGKGLAERNVKQVNTDQAAFDDYVRQTAGAGGPAAEIAHAKELRDNGTITDAEFQQIKQKALA